MSRRRPKYVHKGAKAARLLERKLTKILGRSLESLGVKLIPYSSYQSLTAEVAEPITESEKRHPTSAIKPTSGF